MILTSNPSGKPGEDHTGFRMKEAKLRISRLEAYLGSAGWDGVGEY